MKDIWYSLIVLLPSLIFIILLFLVVCLFERTRGYLEELKGFAVNNVFSGIIKAKTTVKIDTSEAANNSEGINSIMDINLYEETRWLLKDIDITDMMEEFSNHLFWLFVCISFGCAIIFWNFLLLDVSYSCNDDDNTKDCFEYQLWNSEAFKTLWRDPIDCNSAAVQNGTVRVVCYKIVFNFGLAAGASYGTFQFTMVVLNVATTLMLKVSKRQTVCRIRAITAIVFVALLATSIAIEATTLGVRFKEGNLVRIFQIIFVLVGAMYFLFFIPWKDVVTSSQETTSRMRNIQRVYPTDY